MSKKGKHKIHLDTRYHAETVSYQAFCFYCDWTGPWIVKTKDNDPHELSMDLGFAHLDNPETLTEEQRDEMYGQALGQALAQADEKEDKIKDYLFEFQRGARVYGQPRFHVPEDCRPYAQELMREL